MTTEAQAVSTALDIQIIIEPILQVVGLIIAGLIAAYVPKAIAAFEKRTHIEFTDKQKQAIYDAVNTSKGIIESKIDQKILSVSHVNINDPAILAEARTAISHIPDAAAQFGMTPENVARLIVGAVDTGSRSKPLVEIATSSTASTHDGDMQLTTSELVTEKKP